MSRNQTAIFTRRVRDHMRPAPVVVDPVTSTREVIVRMTDQRATAALIVAKENRICGILTEQDVVRRVAFRATDDTPVRKYMTQPVRTVTDDDFLYHAIARMRRDGLRHLPVVKATGAVAGMVHLDDATSVAAENRLAQIDRLTQESSLDGLREVKAAQVDIAEELFAENLPVPEIQSVLTHINNDLYRRVVERQLENMADSGWGLPPVAFCVIVMGSGGRGESYLYPDQDNGFILDDYPDSQHTDIDRYFVELAVRMTQDLDKIGIPLCKGHVMATNPVWRKTASQWHDQITLWCRRQSLVALRFSDIFFDFKSVYGEIDLAADLRRNITRIVAANPSFLRAMYEDDIEHGVALGWFGRFVTEKYDRDHLGAINLKHTGTLPLVESLRLLALREGISETATLDRLAALRERDILEADVTDYLTGAYQHITQLLLRQQIADFRRGESVSNYVHPDNLSRRERDILVDSFKAINRLRDRVRSDFTGDVF
jgi:CBS domain-containing protein